MIGLRAFSVDSSDNLEGQFLTPQQLKLSLAHEVHRFLANAGNWP
jgi:hypothetical protein